MASDVSSPRAAGCRQGAGAAPGRMSPPATGAPQHPHTFKLRFASEREPGRSYVSLVKPLALPATVTGKPYSRRSEAEQRQTELEARALRRVQDMFERGPREKHDQPALSSHVYGWWWDVKSSDVSKWDRRLNHHIRDSSWLKARVRVLAADRALNQR